MFQTSECGAEAAGGGETKSDGEVVKDLGLTVTSDGWTDTCRRPFMNILVGCSDGFVLTEVKDCTGLTKDAAFIAAMIIAAILALPCAAENVRSVVLDGAKANRNAFDIIEAKFPWIECQWCSAHLLGLLLKDIDKIPPFPQLVEDAKDVVNFIKVLLSLSLAMFHSASLESSEIFGLVS